MKEAIINLVTSHKGMKDSELSAILVTKYMNFNTREIVDEIESLVKNGELIEIDFGIPGDKYLTRYYVPRGTEINMRVK